MRLTIVKITTLILLAFLSFGTAIAAEKDYVRKHCKGEIEYVLPDKTRVDCLTRNYAFEYDYGPNWAEAVGQSLHYSRMTGQAAGIVLIEPKGIHRKRLQTLIWHWHLPITICTIVRDIYKCD